MKKEIYKNKKNSVTRQLFKRQSLLKEGKLNKRTRIKQSSKINNMEEASGRKTVIAKNNRAIEQ